MQVAQAIGKQISLRCIQHGKRNARIHPAESLSPKVLAGRPELRHDEYASPLEAGMPHKLKNNHHVRGNAIEH